MGLDINIKTRTKGTPYEDCDIEDEIWLNGRRTYNDLVFNIIGVKDEDYGKDVPITKEKAAEAVEYIVHQNQNAAAILALWIILDLDITFEADW